MATQILMQMPDRYLYSGMEIEEDVFSDAGQLLIHAGVVLDGDIIEKIKLKNPSRYIYVSKNVYSKIIKDNSIRIAAETKSPDRKKLEWETGYADDMDETTDILKEIADKNKVPEKPVYSLCEKISRRIQSKESDTILELVNALAPIDEYLQRHVINVGMLNGLLGKWLDLPTADINDLILVGLLHDCGKMIIPQEILYAPRRLTHVEIEVMKMHTVYSYKITEAFPEPVRLAAMYHHEKINGKGYPHSLKDKDIPLAARITAVSDIYDAMGSRRVYKEPVSPFIVLAKILKLRETELDSRIVDLLVEKIPDDLMGKPVAFGDVTNRLSGIS